MNSKQLAWVMFGISLVISLVFLSVLVRVNYDLDQMRRAFDVQQKQIDQLTSDNHAIHEQLLKMLHTDDQLARDIDVTQELQRKQALAVGDLKKNKKH